MTLTDQISQKRDEINAHHDVAAKHLRDFYREQNLISALNEELERLLLLEQREALRKAPHLSNGEHNAYPHGRYAAIEKGGV